MYQKYIKKLPGPRAPFVLRALYGVRAPFNMHAPLTILGRCFPMDCLFQIILMDYLFQIYIEGGVLGQVGAEGYLLSYRILELKPQKPQESTLFMSLLCMKNI